MKLNQSKLRLINTHTFKSLVLIAVIVVSLLLIVTPKVEGVEAGDLWYEYRGNEQTYGHEATENVSTRRTVYSVRFPEDFYFEMQLVAFVYSYKDVGNDLIVTFGLVTYFTSYASGSLQPADLLSVQFQIEKDTAGGSNPTNQRIEWRVSDDTPYSSGYGLDQNIKTESESWEREWWSLGLFFAGLVIGEPVSTIVGLIDIASSMFSGASGAGSVDNADPSESIAISNWENPGYDFGFANPIRQYCINTVTWKMDRGVNPSTYFGLKIRSILTLNHDPISDYGEPGIYDSDPVYLRIYPNLPPNQPSTPDGDTVVAVNAVHEYTTSTTDPDGHPVQYEFNWGTGYNTTTSWFPSGQEVTVPHSWSSPGTYEVTVRAQSYGLWSNPSPPLVVQVIEEPGHDINVIGLQVSPATVLIGEPVTVIVYVKNEGVFIETFDVTTYYDSDNFIGEQTVYNLAPGDWEGLYFPLDTTDVAEGEHVIKAVAEPVPYETDTADNTREAGMYVYAPVHNIDTNLGYATIQDAIDAPQTEDGHTIQLDEGIYAGKYYESVVVNKDLTIEPSSPSEHPIIDGDGADHVVTVQSDGVTISQITIQGGDIGVYVEYCSSVEISECDISHNDDTGIYLYNCIDSTVSDNTLTDNGNQWGGNGILIDNWYSTDEIGRNIIEGNMVSDSEHGIMVFHSRENTVKDNIIVESSDYGIYIFASLYNEIVGNWVVNTEWQGLWLYGSSYNTIHHNNFINNNQHAKCYEPYPNTWSSDNGVGNFWDGYTDQDQDGDGIWDNPYPIPDGHEDPYPLVWRWFPGDLDGDGDVDRYDSGIFSSAYGYQIGDPNYNPLADLDYDGDVDRYDSGIFSANYGKSIPY